MAPCSSYTPAGPMRIFRLNSPSTSLSLPHTTNPSPETGNDPSQDSLSVSVREMLSECELELVSTIETHGPNHFNNVQILATLGLCYQHMTRNHQKALDYHQEALRILRECRESDNDCHKICVGMAATLNDIAFIYETQAELKLALDHYAEAKMLLLSVNAKQTDTKLIASTNGFARLSRRAGW